MSRRWWKSNSASKRSARLCARASGELHVSMRWLAISYSSCPVHLSSGIRFDLSSRMRLRSSLEALRCSPSISIGRNSFSATPGNCSSLMSRMPLHEAAHAVFGAREQRGLVDAVDDDVGTGVPERLQEPAEACEQLVARGRVAPDGQVVLLALLARERTEHAPEPARVARQARAARALRAWRVARSGSAPRPTRPTSRPSARSPRRTSCSGWPGTTIVSSSSGNTCGAAPTSPQSTVRRRHPKKISASRQNAWPSASDSRRVASSVVPLARAVSRATLSASRSTFCLRESFLASLASASTSSTSCRDRQGEDRVEVVGDRPPRDDALLGLAALTGADSGVLELLDEVVEVDVLDEEDALTRVVHVVGLDAAPHHLAQAALPAALLAEHDPRGRHARVAEDTVEPGVDGRGVELGQERVLVGVLEGEGVFLEAPVLAPLFGEHEREGGREEEGPTVVRGRLAR